MAFMRKLRLAVTLLAALLCMLPCSGLRAESSPDELPRLHACFTEMGAEPQRYDMAVWEAWNKPLLPVARAAVPHLKAVMYRQLFFVTSKDVGDGATAATYDSVVKQHPDWLLRHTNGDLVNIPDYPQYWAVDPANTQWQSYWIAKTLSDVIGGGWDGVFIDDVLTTVAAHQLSGRPPLAGYPNDASLQAAVQQFLARIYPVFQRQGKLVILNVSDSDRYPGLLEQWLQVSDGYMEEHFAGDGWTWGDEVATRQLEAMRLAAQRGKWMLCMTYGAWSDRGKMDQSMAAYLVGAHPKITWAYRPPGDGPVEGLGYPEWVRELGKPISEPEQVNGLWRREFAAGSVVVNPTPQPLTDQADGRHEVIEPRGYRVWRRAGSAPADDPTMSSMQEPSVKQK